ncbi:MAG: branched-chain amino acid ABC transporter permease [Acetobacteraceae bacterium]
MKQDTLLRQVLPSLVLLAIALAAPSFTSSGFALRIGMLVFVYAILGFGFNLLVGLAGQLSLGQQGFFAIGGYAVVLLQTNTGLPLLAAMPIALVICGLTAALVGATLMRLRSHYLAMATLMFGLIVQGMALRLFDLTNGSAGLRMPIPNFAGWQPTRIETYYVVIAITVVAFLVHAFVVSTFAGRAFRAMRVDEVAAQSTGIDVSAYKLKLFILAAIFAGLAGCTSAIVTRQVDPTYSDVAIVISMLTLGVVGGLRSWYGPVIGATVVTIVPQFISTLQALQPLLYGLGLLAVLIFLPRGLAGVIDSGIVYLTTRRKTMPLGDKVAANRGAR